MAKKLTAEQQTAVNEIKHYGEALKKSIKLSFAFLCEEPKQMSTKCWMLSLATAAILR